MEKNKAQSEMTKPRIKAIYKYFEKKSDALPTEIMETFVACLQKKSPFKIGPLDVEYYLRKHSSLIVACNKIKPADIDRSLASEFLEVLKKFNKEINSPHYIKFLPFYVWIDTVCQMVVTGVRQREAQLRVDEEQQKINEQNVEIDKKRVILAYLRCDPEAQKENEELEKLWGNTNQDFQREIDQDNQKAMTFES